MSVDLLIVGASTRAAAFSALRGGLSPICIDLFGDADLRAVADVITADNYPHDLPAIASRLPLCSWMYTGGLENHPRIVERISESRLLLGIGSEVLARIRDPWWIALQLQVAELPVLEVWPAGDTAPPRDGQWLRKPLRGAGGRGICVWNAAAPRDHEPTYFQRRAVGESYSALFLAGVSSAGVPQTELLGVTRQLTGLAEVNAAPFAWCGTLAPANIDVKVRETMRRIGERLTANAGLRGLFGCDFIVEGQVPLLTEVNPRYTAGMELLDFRNETSLVARHMATFCGTSAGETECARARSVDHVVRSQQPKEIDGKLILFAERDLIAGDATRLIADPRLLEHPVAADLPVSGQPIFAGQPICTVFARERTEKECLSQLHQLAGEFRAEFLRDAGR